MICPSCRVQLGAQIVRTFTVDPDGTLGECTRVVRVSTVPLAAGTLVDRERAPVGHCRIFCPTCNRGVRVALPVGGYMSARHVQNAVELFRLALEARDAQQGGSDADHLPET